MADLEHGVARTKALVFDNAGLDFEQMVSEHPLMGVSNVPQILTFLARHERRHQRQMEALRTRRGFPPA